LWLSVKLAVPVRDEKDARSLFFSFFLLPVRDEKDARISWLLMRLQRASRTLLSSLRLVVVTFITF
jgi:hypothetical protein